jgi:polar amino acid transport system substrate-binding protein
MGNPMKRLHRDNTIMTQGYCLAVLLWLCALSGLVAAETPSTTIKQQSIVTTKTTVIKIGAEDDWYPYSAKRDGKPVGMAAEIVSAAFAAAKVDIQLVSLPYARCMSETSKAEIAGCFDTLRNPLNETQYLWHKTPLFPARIVIYGPAKHSGKPLSVSDLTGKSVAVTNGYDYGEAFDSDKTIKRDSGLMDINGLRKLAQGKVDYAVIYDRNAQYLLKENVDIADKIKVVGTLIEPNLYLSFSKDYPNIKQIIKQFDTGIDIIRANGDYAKILEKWQLN